MPRIFWNQEKYERFVEVWQESDNVDEVATTFNIDRQQAYYRAGNLRKQGIPLKKYKQFTNKWSQAKLDRFIKAWQQADGVDEVAKAFKISKQTAMNRAVDLRKQGIPLKHHAGSKQVLDYDKLTKIARKFEPTQ